MSDLVRALNAEFGADYHVFLSTCIHNCGCGGRLWASRRNGEADLFDADNGEAMRELILTRLNAPRKGGENVPRGGGS